MKNSGQVREILQEIRAVQRERLEECRRPASGSKAAPPHSPLPSKRERMTVTGSTHGVVAGRNRQEAVAIGRASYHRSEEIPIEVEVDGSSDVGRSSCPTGEKLAHSIPAVPTVISRVAGKSVQLQEDSAARRRPATGLYKWALAFGALVVVTFVLLIMYLLRLVS